MDFAEYRKLATQFDDVRWLCFPSINNHSRYSEVNENTINRVRELIEIESTYRDSAQTAQSVLEWWEFLFDNDWQVIREQLQSNYIFNLEKLIEEQKRTVNNIQMELDIVKNNV